MQKILSIGLGEKKRSIIKSSSPSERVQTIMEMIRVMLEEISRNEGRIPLLGYFQNRFHIEKELAKSYLSLLVLLLDTKEGDALKGLQKLSLPIIMVRYREGDKK